MRGCVVLHVCEFVTIQDDPEATLESLQKPGIDEEPTPIQLRQSVREKERERENSVYCNAHNNN